MRLREWAALAALILVFLGLGLLLGQTKAPWCDEAWFANPAYNLAFRGYMGTNVLEPSGHFLNAYLTGIRERTYIVTPNHLVALAGWFRLTGFSLLSQRLYSLLWGGLAVAALFALVWKTFGSPPVAILAAGFLSVDFVFLWGSADGRMEASSCALALWSLFTYLHWRQTNLTKAVVVSQILLASAVFIHPYALLLGVTVPVCAWCFDRQRLEPWRHGMMAAAPYLVLGSLWGLYILESPEAFRAQFFANAGGHGSERWKNLLMPWYVVWLEIARQIAVHCTGDLWTGVRNDFGLLICFMHWGAAAYLWSARRSLDSSRRTFDLAFVTVLLSMTFLNGFKAFCYLMYLHPFYCGALAFLVVDQWRKGASGRLLATTLAGLLILLQAGRIVSHIQADEYGRQYLPLVAALQEERARGRSIIASSVVGYGLGFSGFEDDWRLGLHTGRRPDVLVLDRSYRNFACRFEEKEPQAFAHVVEALTTDYRLRRKFGNFWLLERRKPGDPPPALADAKNVASDVETAGETFFNRVAGERLTRCGG